MKKKNSWLLLAVAVCLLVALCVGLASCGKEPETAAPVVGTEKVTYTVTLKTEGGKALEEVGVYFYTDSTMEELVWFAKTDADGKVSFTDLESTGYVAVLDNPPDGYKVEPYYPLTAQNMEIILATDMADGDLASLSYGLGDVMMNFSVTDVDGKTWVLSDLLAEKQAVVLNFWYLQCAPCKAEFPYLQEAYEKYSDKIALVALNPINDSREEIAAFAVENGLTFPMAHCDPAWEQAMQLTAYPTTVIIDRFGTIALIHKGSIDDSKVFEDAFEFFTADEYEQTTVENIEDLEIKAAGSDSSNPIEIGSKTSFEVTVEPGQMVYYHIYRVDGMTLTINNGDVYAVYNGSTFRPNGGKIAFTVKCPDTYTPAAVALGNSGEETETFTVRLTAKPGTVDNPHVLKLGDFTANVSAGNDQGVFHSYTPAQDGILTVQCTGITPTTVKYGISLTTQKGNATVQRNLEEDGDTEKGSVSIPVKKGVKVQIVVSTLPDDTKSYPAATVKCSLSIGEDTSEEEETTEKVTYAVTVTDQDRKPVPNVVMKLASAQSLAEESTAVSEDIKTNEKGVASMVLEAGTYDVILNLANLKQYEAATAQFRLTEDRPYASIKLTELVVEMKTYTITVTDENGKPLADAMVTIGTAFATTGADGTVTLEVPKADHSVYITPPSGYIAESEYALKADSTGLTAALAEGSSEDVPDDGGEKIPYTVTVLDYSGKVQSGVMVQFLRNGKVAATQPTDGNGIAAVSLSSAEYTVTLAFSGTKLYCESEKAVLPVGTTSLTLRVAPGVNESSYDMIYDKYLSYYVTVGNTYAELQANLDNYFIFHTKTAGDYHVTTSDPNAKVSYRGGSTAFINEHAAYVDSFDLNVKDSYISDGDYGYIAVFSITGADDCIIQITREGDAQLDETDLEPEVYKAKKTPKNYKFTGTASKLTYVDMSGKTTDYKIVKGSDGYYHLNSATGPLLYMHIAPPNPPFQCLYYMAGAGGNGVAGNGIKATLYDDSGKAYKRLDFSECMLSYGECADSKTGLYPLTEDLVYIVQTAGKYYGWWDSTSANFWLSGVKNLNPELGWMFAVCYIPQ